MICKECGEPCAWQFDYCYEHRKARREARKLTELRALGLDIHIVANDKVFFANERIE